MCRVTWRMKESEARDDLVLIETLLLFSCKFQPISMRTTSLTWEKQPHCHLMALEVTVKRSIWTFCSDSRGLCFLREVFLKPFNKLAGHVLSGLKPNKTPWPAESFIKRYMYLELCRDLKSHWVLMHCIHLSSLLYNAKLIIKISPNGVCVRRI